MLRAAVPSFVSSHRPAKHVRGVPSPQSGVEKLANLRVLYLSNNKVGRVVSLSLPIRFYRRLQTQHRLFFGARRFVSFSFLIHLAQIKDMGEMDRLAVLERLEDLLLAGNPLYNEYRDTNATAEYRIEVREGSGGCMRGGHAAAWCHQLASQERTYTPKHARAPTPTTGPQAAAQPEEAGRHPRGRRREGPGAAVARRRVMVPGGVKLWSNLVCRAVCDNSDCVQRLNI